MLNLVSLLVAAALVSLQCGLEANAQIDNSKIELDNSLQPNMIHSTKRRRPHKYVHLYQPPPETARAQPGRPLELECQATGSPSPVISWLRNGEPVIDYEEGNEIQSSHPSSFARLTSKIIIPAPMNGDIYTCVATAGLMEKSASTTILADGDEATLTLEKLFRRPSPPVISAFYNELIEGIGTNIILPCRIVSNTKAQVYWQDNDEKLVYGDNRLRVLPSGDLLIPSMRWSDMGQYTCSVKNAFGKDSQETFLYPIQE